MVRAIGGYFELENRFESEYYPNLIRLNTGRNCLEYILRARAYKKIYLPEYSCDAVMEPILKLGLKYEKYPINMQLEPDQLIYPEKDEAFLAINYFGLKGRYVNFLTRRLHNLIVDNSQAFFEVPVQGFDTFYSTRKFFGVSDGAYLSTDSAPYMDFKQEVSWKRSEHLLRRLENGPNDGYPAFKRNEEYLCGQEIKLMSDLTYRILSSIDYTAVKSRRNRNFQYLHLKLKGYNGLSINDADIDGPMVYPFYVEIDNLREELMLQEIYTASYWPSVIQNVESDKLEYKLAKYLIPLPVDQRYGLLDMDRICKLIIQLLKQ
ncbi:hypothetical protein DF185_16460 [Marinifilum breve]|uniref:DegT/DnrJ/EryC1/StrS aminotransferase family protein n=1 Tax=Marinifilum breve TaxID=2184082 RepID=A0A2V3ZWN4_9BACT|nr:hypothetical protein [Marinifilum breve]PXX97930.1 hypothetical protein DF185_16460 [Marinifilum breve]